MKVLMLEHYQEDRELALNPDGFPLKSLAAGQVYDIDANLAAYLLEHGKAQPAEEKKAAKVVKQPEPEPEVEPQAEPLMSTESAKRGRRGK